MKDLVLPHGGGPLEPRLAPESERAKLLSSAEKLVQVPMTSRETADLVLLGTGAYTPLAGFMNEADWHGVATETKLSDGTFWPIPITLSSDEGVAGGIKVGDEVALADGESGEILATMTVEEKYRPNHSFESEHVFGTVDMDHPGVAKVLHQPPINLSGPVTVLAEGPYRQHYRELCFTPEESRAQFVDLGWSTVAAFQTRNPMHRSHEQLVKTAVEITDGVFIHQVLGKLKEGDIPAEVRVKCIDAMIHNYFIDGTVIQAGLPLEMRYAGPREALLHGVIRQNFGCSHLIVGRDHAGVGKYYGPFDAQHAFEQLWDGALAIQPLKFHVTFFCKKCHGMASAKTCPHEPEHRVDISGTMQREMLAAGESIPPEFSRPEVVSILQEFYAGQE